MARLSYAATFLIFSSPIIRSGAERLEPIYVPLSAGLFRGAGL